MDIKPTFIFAWFATSFITLVAGIGCFLYLSQISYSPYSTQNFQLYAALPNQNGFVTDAIFSSDGRAKIVESFFRRYKTPLYPYAEVFISVADKYDLDWRLLPAIAMQESNGGKKVIDNSHNPFGFGIYGDNVLRFNSWEEGIEQVGKGLKTEYIDKGYTTPEEIMVKYTPPSLSKGGPWARGVNTFMFELN